MPLNENEQRVFEAIERQLREDRDFMASLKRPGRSRKERILLGVVLGGIAAMGLSIGGIFLLDVAHDNNEREAAAAAELDAERRVLRSIAARIALGLCDEALTEEAKIVAQDPSSKPTVDDYGWSLALPGSADVPCKPLAPAVDILLPNGTKIQVTRVEMLPHTYDGLPTPAPSP